ncbi:hypothetical protein PL81_21235 [Streptomyces sp. RSD-27]|nr:hypothetical protein PL81_21235 [Streptomyces sp. RSD-27]
MLSDAEYVAIKDRALVRLFAIPGVVIVGIGGRERGGRATGERSIRVFVHRKLAREEVPSGELVPAAFEGVGTDVVDMAAPDPAPPACEPQGPTGSPPGSPDRLDGRKYQWLVGGALVCSGVDTSRPGTIGGFLEHTTDPAKVYLLSAQHVLGEGPPLDHPTKADQDTRIYHPLYQTWPLDRLFDNRTVGRFRVGDRDGVVDAAAAQLDTGTRWAADILGIGSVTGTYTLTQQDADTHCFEVRKSGIATGRTGGTVQAVNASHNIDGTYYHNLIVVKPNPNRGQPAHVRNCFADHGDSGALVVDDQRRAVGMLIAGFGPPLENPATFGWTKVTPIDVVLDYFVNRKQLPVRLATAQREGVVKVVGRPPSASSAAAPAALSGLGSDLSATLAGRRLIRLWRDHGRELADLARQNGHPAPELLDTVVRMVADPALTVPAAIGGVPLAEFLGRLHTRLAEGAGAELRSALARSRSALPDDLVGLTYRELLDALRTPEEASRAHD